MTLAEPEEAASGTDRRSSANQRLVRISQPDGLGTLFIGRPKSARPRLPREITTPNAPVGLQFPL